MNRLQTLAVIPLIALCSGASLSAGSSALAQSESGLDWVRIKYSTLFNREPFGWSQAQVERRFGLLFSQALLAGNDSLSATDEKLAMDIGLAQARANTMRNVLASDLNADFKVSRDEVRTALRYKYATRTARYRESRMQREFDRIMRSDLNRDGSITLDEIRKSADVQAALRGTSRYSSTSARRIPMSLDQNDDKILTRDEFLSAVRKIFAAIDTDSNTSLSEAEMRSFMTGIRKIRQRQARERRKLYSARRMARTMMKCRLPDMPKQSKLVFAATYRGQGLANVTFKNRQTLLSVAHLHIEEGPDNLALVLSAPGNVIWQLTGVTERVAKVYLGSRFGLGKQASVAVTGVAKSKVHFIEASGCLPYNFRSDAEVQQIKRSLRAITGADPVAVIAAANKRMVSLPSGKTSASRANPLAIALPKGSAAAPLWSAVSRSFPAGIVRLQADKVISQTPLVRGEVLPGRAGIAQLIDQGALEVSGSTGSGSGVPVLQLPVKELRIIAPIQMPPGIGYSVVRKFVLAKDVAVPKGLASRVCVVNEADGKPVAGSGRCR